MKTICDKYPNVFTNDRRYCLQWLRLCHLAALCNIVQSAQIDVL